MDLETAHELHTVARHVVWFKEPQETLLDTPFFLAYLMTYGTIEDILIARKYYTPDDFKAALTAAPPGIFDARSWSYWNLIFDRLPIPPMPKRHLA